MPWVRSESPLFPAPSRWPRQETEHRTGSVALSPARLAGPTRVGAASRAALGRCREPSDTRLSGSARQTNRVGATRLAARQLTRNKFRATSEDRLT
jgi:hypothetical protein